MRLQGTSMHANDETGCCGFDGKNQTMPVKPLPTIVPWTLGYREVRWHRLTSNSKHQRNKILECDLNQKHGVKLTSVLLAVPEA